MINSKTAPTRVDVLGCNLAAMMRDMASSANDCEGFMFGREVQTTATMQHDNEENVVVANRVFELTQWKVMSNARPFYNAAGKIFPGDLQKILTDDEMKSLIGYFKFRRNAPLIASVKDRRVYQHLLHFYASYAMQNPTNRPTCDGSSLLLAIFTATYTDNQSAHTYDWIVQHSLEDDRSLEPIEISIKGVELSDDIGYSHVSPPLTIDGTNSVRELSKHILNFETKETLDCNTINAICINLLRELTEKSNRLYESDRTIGSLRAKAAQLKIAEARNKHPPPLPPKPTLHAKGHTAEPFGHGGN